MNLQEVLDYRNKCVICHRDMILKCAKSPKTKAELTDKGLRISSGYNYLFKFDGTYERGRFHNKPFIIKKECPVCISDVVPQPVILLKSRSVGATTMIGAMTAYFGANYTKTTQAQTTLNDLKKQGCSYIFACIVDNAGKYEVKIASEYIRYCTKEEFWHLNTNFKDVDSKTDLHHGRYEDTLNGMLTLHLPAVSTANIKTKEQFINKFKLYTLFS